MDIEIDNQGGLYVSGLFSDTATFGSNIVTAVQPSSNSITVSDNFLVKYDTSGVFKWIKTGATTRNDFTNNPNGFNNNSFNYYARSKIKFKNNFVYLMASNKVSNSTLGVIPANGRKFDGIVLPNTQVIGGGGFNGYSFDNSFILKTDINGNNSWLTSIYCNTTDDFDAIIGLDFDVKSNGHIVSQYYYSSNGFNIQGGLISQVGGANPVSISGFSTPNTVPLGAMCIIELDNSGVYFADYKIENLYTSFSYFGGFGSNIDYISYGISVDDSNNVFLTYNNQNNGQYNQLVNGINIPERSNVLMKLNSNLLPTNFKILNSFPSQTRNNFPITALEIKKNNLILVAI